MVEHAGFAPWCCWREKANLFQSEVEARDIVGEGEFTLLN
jgi:hypothetical protein